ncbi:hypothetical protein [Lignipirellula cremea]|uniref:Pentapeptide repeats (8 copies) n=1 Tax=Lignipirellula cremea TaxID=2528010 RepID=A0A518DYD7_9BACT|nr:hypothetical protein [Lignipirellula cremea]QDU96805.1 hypothetical protein Pla8534_46260 [Lignipirellula cremea]
MNLQSVEIENQEMVINDTQDFNAIGPDVILKNCTLRLKVPAKCLSIRGTLEHTKIHAQRKLGGFSWVDAKLKFCTFQGKFPDNAFGEFAGSKGYCLECDFSSADIDGCMFFGKSSTTHRYPAWPSFVLLDPHVNWLAMKAKAMPDWIADDVNSIEYLHKEVTAVGYNAQSLSKHMGVSIEDIRQFYSQFDFVILHDNGVIQ